MKTSILSLCISVILAAAATTHAAITIDTQLVGNTGNASDTTGYGSVGYDYHIGTYSVTNSQYTSFLNSVAGTDTHSLYNINMSSSLHGGIDRAGSAGSYSYSVKTGFENKPVVFVSFWNAARFANWLTTGGTETGVYSLGGVTNPTNNTIARDATSWANGGVAVASENEWYKAAYYDPTLNGGSGEYWLYATQSNTISQNDANYFELGSEDNVGTVSDVGLYSHAPSYYGTFDQSGNTFEWNDELLSTTERGMRGGSFNNGIPPTGAEYRIGFDPTLISDNFGFRLSSLAPIPEPSTYAVFLGAGSLFFVAWRRRVRRKA